MEQTLDDIATGEAERLLRQDLPPELADADLVYLQSINRAPPAPTASAASPATTDHSWSVLRGAGG